MAALPRFGVISLAALDLRRRPDHKSELTSQLLLGEVVRVLETSKDGRWWRIENQVDRYRGWIRTWGVVAATAGAARAWESEARAQVRVSHADLRSARSGGRLVSPLFWQGRLIAGPVRGGMRPAELPDGRRGWVDAAAVVIGSRARIGIADRIRELLGVPYLWGGRTPSGLDCSSFVQLVLGEQGIRLPRDADDQCSACDPLPDSKTLRAGDLVFFGVPRRSIGHVGLALGNGAYAHARGCVRINSLASGNPLFDKELFGQVRAFGRPRRRARWGADEGEKPDESA
jgi:gamma-D-glutamyl-L-lysine dipeptidyl-peptidase